MRSGLGLWLQLMIILIVGCGGTTAPKTGGPGPGPGPSPTPTPVPVTTIDHVALVILENHSLFQVIGSPAMPYFNSLVMRGGLATQYFANVHPSMGDYFFLTTGLEETSDDGFTGLITDDNIVRALMGAGKTWKAYLEGLPSPGYIGGDVYPYVKRHNPMAYLSDVVTSSAVAANMVPFGQLEADMKAGALPSFAFIIPNVINDAHDCPGNAPACPDDAKLSTADAWLRANLDPLLNSPAFANGVLIITWDEGDGADVAHGGGQVATVIAGAKVRPGFQSATFFQHQSALRLVLDLLQVADHPGDSASAPAMAEFFQ